VPAFPGDSSMAETTPARIRLRIPHLLGLAVLVIFVPWVLLTGKSERDARRAIEGYQPFRSPTFPVKFSRAIKYDSLGFLGRGSQAGFWQWTPEGMVLLEKGRPYFSETPQTISCNVGAGQRVVSKIESHRDAGGKREVRFIYYWEEVTPPAAALLSTPPEPGRQYDGRAVLVRQAGTWVVEFLETPHLDKPMALLVDESREIRR